MTPSSATRERLVLVTTGLDETGTESVAAWWMGILGEPLAGWLFPATQAFGDPVIADRLLTVAAGGLLVASDPAGCRALLDRLRISAGRASMPGTPRPILHIGHVVVTTAKRSRITTSRSSVTIGRCPVVDQVLATSELLQAWARTGRAVAPCGPACPARCAADRVRTSLPGRTPAAKD